MVPDLTSAKSRIVVLRPERGIITNIKKPLTLFDALITKEYFGRVLLVKIRQFIIQVSG